MQQSVPVRNGSLRGNGHRALWLAVVQQALDDIVDEQLGGCAWRDACLFLTASRGPWADSRQEVADRLELHADDIARAGRRAIRARRIAEGLPPEPPTPQPVAAPPPRPAPPPCLVATFEPQPKIKRGGWSRRRSSDSGFDPYLPLPSELRRTG